MGQIKGMLILPLDTFMENQKAIKSLKPFHSIEQITTDHNFNHRIDIHSSFWFM